MLEYAAVVTKSDLPENLRIRLSPEKKARLKTLCDRKKITQQAAVEAMVEFLLSADGTLVSMVLGQIDEKYKGEIAEMVLRDLTAGPGPRLHKAARPSNKPAAGADSEEVDGKRKLGQREP